MLRSNKNKLQNKVCHKTLETSGQLVPLFHVSPTGQIQKRHWAWRNARWCSLCNEPIEDWDNLGQARHHHGRGDHTNADLHYNAIVEYCYRTWNCEHILRHLFVKTKKRRKDGKRRSACDLAPVSMQYFLAKIHADELKRRQDIYHLALYLHRKHVLVLDRGRMHGAQMTRVAGGTNLQGSLALHEFVTQAMLRLFPEADVGLMSNFQTFLNANYHFETVYDLCGFRLLDQEINGAERAAAKAAQDSARRRSTNPTGAETEKEEAFSLDEKGSFVRNIMGQLRFALSEDKPHPLGLEVSAPVRLICVYLVKAIIVELIGIKSSEYMIRCDPIWRTLGMERRNIAELMAAHEETLQYGVEYAAPSTYYAPGVGMYRRIALHGKDLYRPAEPSVNEKEKEES